MIIRSARVEGELQTEEYQFATLEIERTQSLRGILQALNGAEQEYSDLIVIVGDKKISFEKDSLIVYNPLAFDINDKKLLTALYKKLENEINGNVEIISELQIRLYDLAMKLDNLINNNCYDISIETSVQAKDILKLFDVRLEKNSSVASGINNFLLANADLKLFKLIIFVNAKDFFSDAEIEEVTKCISSTETAAIFIESKHSSKLLPNERKIYLDPDGYEVII